MHNISLIKYLGQHNAHIALPERSYSLGPLLRPIPFFFFFLKKKTNATRRHRVTSVSATPRYRATQLSRSATDHISFLNVTVRHRVTLLLVRDRSYFLYSTPWHRATPLSWSAEDVFFFNATAWSSDAAL